MTADTIQLVPDEETKAKRLFGSDQEYEAFRRSFQEQVKDDLERQQDARRQSEEQAKKLIIS